MTTTTTIKSESGPGDTAQHNEEANADIFDEPMDYTTENTSVHPLAPAHPAQQLSPSYSPSQNMHESSAPATMASQQTHESLYRSTSIQPQQHQQLLKLKTEHGFSTTAPSPLNGAGGTPPDIVMTNEDHPEILSPAGAAGHLSRRASSDVNMGASEATMRDVEDAQTHPHPMQRGAEGAQGKGGPLVVDTSSNAVATRHNSISTATPSSAMNMETPSTAGGGLTAPSSRRGSLRTITATLPRSALQEETIALFKQYRNLIPCAKCFCRNTIQRDGMSDGNLRFKCRPPVSMSLICNKSYSESKIRNMIAGVVYGHSLPDSTTSNSASNPGNGDNVLALAPPPTVKAPRRSSTAKNETSPRLSGAEKASSASERMQRLQEDPEHRGGEDMARHSHSLDARRSSHPYLPPQGSSSRRGSLQPLRRPSLVADDSVMMDYEDSSAQTPNHHSGHLQVPGTPPMDSEDPRLCRPRSGFGHSSRSVTPSGSGHQASSQALNRQGGQKLHHSHSHPNIGQQRHQQFLEQQELQREHRGSISATGYSNQQQQQQRPLQRQIVRRDSSQYLGGGGPERRSSQPSPVPGSSKFHPGPGSGNEALSPALSSSPRPSPGRELYPGSAHDQPGTPSSMRSSLPGSSGSGRYDESTNATGYFQRRMSQPHPVHAYSSVHHHSGLPPPLPSPLSHPYDRRASEMEEYPQMHREKYERLNASTLLAPESNAPSSAAQQRQNQYQSQNRIMKPRHGLPPPPPLGSPNAGGEARQHPLDGASLSSSQPNGASSPIASATSPWMNSGSQPQSESMRFSHSVSHGSAAVQAQRPMLRQQLSSTSLYYQTPHSDDRDRFEVEHQERDMSPEYHEFDADGRPVARMRHQGIKRKSLGQSLCRSSSNQNLYAASMQQHQHQYQYRYNSNNNDRDYHNNLAREAVAAPHGIKLTCFPDTDHNNSKFKPSLSSDFDMEGAATKSMNTSDAMAMQLSQGSKLVIEIRQPRTLQSYSSATNLREHMKKYNTSSNNHHGINDTKTLHRTASHPNMQLARTSSTVLGCRRSASPDGDHFGFGASKKRRADSDMDSVKVLSPLASDTGNNNDNESVNCEKTEEGMDVVAAAAVVAAATAASATTPLEASSKAPTAVATGSPKTEVHVFGMDYLSRNNTDSTTPKMESEKQQGVGLGLLGLEDTKTKSLSSPMVEALKVARASSYVVHDEQKEMGVDYSLFTRVETAGWRILIPPNVVASFRSEDFGLMLKPKGLVEEPVRTEDEEEDDDEDNKTVAAVDREMSKDSTVGVVHEGAQGAEEEEDVNVEGVRRIALQDDDKDELEEEAEIMQPHAAVKYGNPMYVEKRSFNDQAQDVNKKASIGRGVEQDDVEMDKEEDELLEDD
ncbi:hypothetical protein BG011_004269 [Mortierella polycephala]|uniref:Uncharacterized protein n=1 Tax=Mortierella polycephala TaxID=41804 RepID=A0A9P6QCN1_9FUNG|nr:hypothetical protein BG011_004269 [Mortierella polycephala]